VQPCGRPRIDSPFRVAPLQFEPAATDWIAKLRYGLHGAAHGWLPETASPTVYSGIGRASKPIERFVAFLPKSGPSLAHSTSRRRDGLWTVRSQSPVSSIAHHVCLHERGASLRARIRLLASMATFLPVCPSPPFRAFSFPAFFASFRE
jgi:hypothetical protein